MRNRSRFLLLAVASFALFRGASETDCRQRPVQRSLVIENASIIDMTRSKAPEVASVWVRDGVIVAIGPLEDMDVPAGTQRIDASGKFLMPGLTDAHVHLFDVNDLPVFLAHGITSVLNMSGAAVQLDWREQIESGQLAGPTLYTTGPQLKPDAQPLVDFERVVDSEAAAERLVAFQAEAGYDFVKVWGALDPERYSAIMNAADAHGIRVTGHIPGDVGLASALAAGQSSIAHVEEFFNKVFERRIDDAGISRAAAATRAAGIPVITTLVTYEAIAGSVAEDPAPLLERDARKWLDPVRQLLWEPEFNRYRTEGRLGRDAEYLEALASMERIALGLHEAGVPLIAGSDAGEMPGLVPGVDLHRELELLERAGLSTFEVLRTATTNAGAYLEPDAPFGTIEVGRRADLLLLEANPIESVANLSRVTGVVTRGRWHSNADIEEMLAGVREINQRTGAFADALLRQGVDAAERYVDGAGGDQPAFADTPALFLAFALAERGDLDGAVRVIRMVADASPESYLPRYMLGVALLGAGQITEGRAALEEVLRLSPRHDLATALLEQIQEER